MFKKRILLAIIVPTIIIGIFILSISTLLMTRPLSKLFREYIHSNLIHYSHMGVTTCDERLADLVSLRLESDPAMNAASKREALEEIKAHHQDFPGIEVIVVEENQQVKAGTVTIPDNASFPLPLDKKTSSILFKDLWGKPYVIHYRYFPFWRWHIISLISQKDYEAPIAIAKSIIALGTFGLLMAIVLAVFILFKFRIDQPLKRIISAAKDVAAGHFHPVEINRTDEIGQVAMAFNVMVKSLASDQAERNALEEKLTRAQKMEAVGALAGSVAHDLNNILGGLVSYPELILMNLPENSPLRKPLLTIRKSGEKAAAIVQDMLTLARRGVVVTEVVNLNKIVQEYMKSPEFEKLLTFHPGVQINLGLSPDLLNLIGSPVHLSKTLMNLVSNAAESMPNGGKAMITTENRTINESLTGYEPIPPGDYVTLSVEDIGVGISPEDLKKIFEPFYTKKIMGRSGTGLGMAVVWGTTKDHHGFIDIRTDLGKGTRIDLYFPVTRKEQPKTKVISEIAALKGSETILIVDDVEEQREIAQRLLKELGYQVQTAPSGEEAIACLKNKKVDLVILDMIMDPGMDGLETYRKILTLHPRQKAIIASGFSETERVKEAQQLGAGAYVKKPYVLRALGLAVRTELDRGK
ncbi:MAG: response regulator [Pseudomonadota bacterium]